MKKLGIFVFLIAALSAALGTTAWGATPVNLNDNGLMDKGVITQTGFSVSSFAPLYASAGIEISPETAAKRILWD